jgi:hypothetical protein
MLSLGLSTIYNTIVSRCTFMNRGILPRVNSKSSTDRQLVNSWRIRRRRDNKYRSTLWRRVRVASVGNRLLESTIGRSTSVGRVDGSILWVWGNNLPQSAYHESLYYYLVSLLRSTRININRVGLLETDIANRQAENNYHHAASFINAALLGICHNSHIRHSANNCWCRPCPTYIQQRLAKAITIQIGCTVGIHCSITGIGHILEEWNYSVSILLDFIEIDKTWI